MTEKTSKDFCGDCDYKKWDGSDPVPVSEFFEKLATIGITPTGEGKVNKVLGSPFRVPLPLMVRICCIDDQICRESGVATGASDTTIQSFEQSMNAARNETYLRVGLPGINQE